MSIYRALLAPLLTLALILSVNMALAFDLSTKPIGSITRWQTNSGNTSIEMLAQEKRLFKLGFTRDASKGQPGFAILWVRKDGQLVEVTFSNGDWTRYKPHNCELTLGTCRYTERHSNGERRKMIHVASMAGGKISYALYHTKPSAANLVEKGVFSVDRYGYLINHDYVRDGATYWSKRIGKADPAN